MAHANKLRMGQDSRSRGSHFQYSRDAAACPKRDELFIGGFQSAGHVLELADQSASVRLEPFPVLPFYPIDGTNPVYVFDDRSVDYQALFQQAQDQVQTNGGGMACSPLLSSLDFTNSTELWLEIPEGGVDESNLSVIVHNTSVGQAYTMLTKQSLNDASWVEEQLLYGTNGIFTPTQLQINGRTDIFVWARSGVPTSLLAILSQPLDQDVLGGRYGHV